MGARPLVRITILAVLGTGCAAIVGLEDPDPIAATDHAEAGAPPLATDAAIDAVDAPSETSAPPCTTPVAPIGQGTVRGVASDAVPPKIDGNFGDWRCVPRAELTKGEFASSGFPATTSAQIAVQWTPSTLYVFALIQTLTPGYAYAQPFENDGLTIYLGGPGAPTATYRTGDHQLVVDHQGFTAHYRNGQAEPWPAAIVLRSASETRDTKITSRFEMAIPASVLGVAAFEPSKPYVFGLQLIDRVDDIKRHEIWYRAPSCGCDGGCCIAGGKNIPACDMRCNGQLVLE